MRTDPAKAGRKPGDGPAEASEQASPQADDQANRAGGQAASERSRPATSQAATRGRWRRWRTWLPFLVKPLRRGIILFILVLIVEYLVVPELVGASKDLNLLGRVDAAWLAAGLVLEGLSLFCYGLLTQALLPPGSLNPGLSRLFRIDLAAAAVAHVIPAGTLGSAGHRLQAVHRRGHQGQRRRGDDGDQGPGLHRRAERPALAVPGGLDPAGGLPPDLRDRGDHRCRAACSRSAALVFGFIRGARRASRILHAVGDRIPGLSGDRLEQAMLDTAASLSALARDRRTLVMSLTWASLNWLLDAASLWCFVAAFGHLVNPVELFAAYGIANVAGALPVTPAGLGVVDSIAPLLLVSFGVTRSVATLGVLGWRLVNFWLPIPVGAVAYVSLKVPRGAGLKAMRAAVSTMLAHSGPAPEAPEEPEAPGRTSEPEPANQKRQEPRESKDPPTYS